MSERAELRKKIIATVLAEHGITVEELTGKFRHERLVAARRDLSFQLRDAGFTVPRIAQILNRDSSAVKYYLISPQTDKRKRASRLLTWLPADIQGIVQAVALASETAPTRVLLDWIIERASEESAARSRTA